jgi:hypothetical protein
MKMSTSPEKLIFDASEYYLNQLLDKIIYKLKRAPQFYRQNPDCCLRNLWEEICVQKQTDNWEGWYLTLAYVESQCTLMVDSQETIIKRILSFEFLQNDSSIIYEEDICDKIVSSLFDRASNYNNQRIASYINF